MVSNNKREVEVGYDNMKSEYKTKIIEIVEAIPVD